MATANGVSSAPVIAARDRLDIGAENLNNREHALIFAGGDMAIGGALDSGNRATGQAGTVNNNSASIEAQGSLNLSARTVNNTNEHFSTEAVEVSRESKREFQYSGSSARYDDSQVAIINDESDDMWMRDANGNGRTLFSKSEDSFTLNMIAADLIRSLELQGNTEPIESAYDQYSLFERAMQSRGYFPATDPEFPADWWRDECGLKERLTDLYIEIVDERRTKPPFGLELSMYSDVGDEGWRFFLFQRQDEDFLIYSKDRGRTVFSLSLKQGKVINIIREYCNAMRQVFCENAIY